ncbi:homocysteine S-methyltransferase family protein, partial [Streptococcus hyovaginalis]
PPVLALGFIGCPPEVGEAFLATLGKGTEKHLVAYPNWVEFCAGKTQTCANGYKVQASLAQCHKDWPLQFPQLRLLGGCCRPMPADIADIKNPIGHLSS